MEIKDHFTRLLPAFMDRVEKLDEGKVIALDPFEEDSKRVSLRAYRHHGVTRVRVRFTWLGPHYESACIMDEIKANAGKAAGKIERMSDRWLKTIALVLSGCGKTSTLKFGATLPKGKRDAQHEDFDLSAFFKPERDLDKGTWIAQDNGTYRYFSDDITLSFKHGGCVMKCRFDNEEKDIHMEREYEIEVSDLFPEATNAVIDSKKKEWDAHANLAWTNSHHQDSKQHKLDEAKIESEIIEGGARRRGYIERITELQAERRKADKSRSADIDKDIGRFRFAVREIDAFANKHVPDMDNYVKTHGGALPDAVSKRKPARSKNVGGGIGIE